MISDLNQIDQKLLNSLHLRFRRTIKTTRCIITGVFISLKMHYENVSEKEPIFADAGVTKRALDA
jgi:hypothetical protein